MQLRFDALDAHLEKSLAPLYVVTSDEHLLAQQALDRIRAQARARGYLEREILTVDRSFKWSSLVQAGQSQSLFGDRKIIDLRMPGGKPGREGGAALQEHAQRVTQEQNPDSITLISCPKLDWATQKSAWVGCLQQLAVYIDIPLVERSQLPAWIARSLKQQGQSAERQALEFIADRVEGNLLAAHQEIQKLGLLYPAGELTAEQIQEAVLNVARYDVFKLSEAILAGDVARMVRMLDGLKGEGEALPLVLWAVADECRTLFRLKLGLQQGRPLSALCKENRIWGGKERLIEPALRRLNLPTLRAAVQHTADIDRLIKGLRSPGLSGDAWDAITQLVLSLAGPTH